MKLQQLPSEFQEALPILEKLKASGYEAYFVGGSVRDAILGRTIHDVDIATSAYPEETKKVFTRTIDVGIEHGTVLVLHGGQEYEITTFRTEDVYVDYRRPSQVSFVRSLEEDLKRRDFTVNAFALNEEADIIDKFHGLKDLEFKILRAVGVPQERFNEDALRIMRGFRFAATLDFDIEEQTFQAMQETAPLLEKISVERIFIEFDKLLTAAFWRKGLEKMIAAVAYDFLPEMKGKGTCLKAMLDRLRPDFLFATSEQAWAMLLIALDINEPKNFLKKWKTSNDFQKAVLDLVAAYRTREKTSVDKFLVYQYGLENLLLVEQIRQAQDLPIEIEQIKALDAALLIHSKHEIVVNGRTLMTELNLKAGPNLGRILSEIEKAIVLGELMNEKEAIFKFLKEKGMI
ncbi:CCA tRNA nucleotidyltransferase [Streptococcus minor]|uniref:CCA-adding enzyme n=1 Tax=Streptococcus minor TaxID=229549 RepID=A0A3P1VF58_9STRE|nr:CCA tRNA nucleotidyltransferase [Streptococcus minor]RRD32327.1 CCA tRNA nucleotidyltransferase [Streptococcus minor]